jgi:hypothetical protein
MRKDIFPADFKSARLSFFHILLAGKWLLRGLNSIAGYRHRGRCHQQPHTGILYLSPVPEHSGAELLPELAFLFTLVPD